MSAAKKKISLTGIKSSSAPHLGNYIGAIRPALEMAKTGQFEGYYFIADYHSLNSIQDPKQFEKNVYDTAATWMALGLDLNQHNLYRQSDIPEILEITSILSCFCSKGLMNRAHSYKAATAKNTENGKDPDWGINMGLYNYPILMAADILTFKGEIVPVGPDQVQHIEMTRDMAQCFNSNYKRDLFVLPEGKIQDAGLIPGLDGRKMSSSYDNYILLFEEEKRLKKLINKIKSDSSAPDEPKDPDTSTIFQIYTCFANDEQIKSMRASFKSGISWGEAKAQLFEVVNAELAGPREIYRELMDNPEKIREALKWGCEKVRPKASDFLKELKSTIGCFAHGN